MLVTTIANTSESPLVSINKPVTYIFHSCITRKDVKVACFDCYGSYIRVAILIVSFEEVIYITVQNPDPCTTNYVIHPFELITTNEPARPRVLLPIPSVHRAVSRV
jgi:hypothetical protein